MSRRLLPLSLRLLLLPLLLLELLLLELLLLELLLLELLEEFELLLLLLGLGSLLRGDSLGGLGLSLRGLSGVGFRSSCPFETVAVKAPNKSADVKVKTLKLFFVKLDFILLPPLCAAALDELPKQPSEE
ncbi:MAG: hypothetical protein QOF72_2425 [Blastocatellia bacterium]|nr:hypothetical protein [Blastocatellia bacterium]